MARTTRLYWAMGPLSILASTKPFSDLEAPFKRTRAPQSKEFAAFCMMLLKHSGTTVVITEESLDLIPILIAEGAMVAANKVVRKRGKVSDCHANAARLWRKKLGNLMTGFAYSDDCWRRHSWIVDKKGTLTETTESRAHYFGIVLPPAFAKKFAQLYLDD
jgi:hypothetical protein